MGGKPSRRKTATTLTAAARSNKTSGKVSVITQEISMGMSVADGYNLPLS
jgi:hypothetical protein